ncbi:uncharacterized protein TrAtP1_009454 [Trichoderma atroviride]|nr:hypothetical protein TrAtP1_009454 [Trichoderma atroviride]
MKPALGKQFLVSKKHLILASRRAGKVLEGSFKEATAEKDGLFHWDFEPIFDSMAFEIVMYIIHGHTRHVPEKVNVKLLAQIAAIVDDLECQNSIWFFAKRWLGQMECPHFHEMSKDLMRWILISFVFEESEIFKQVTNDAIRYSTDKTPTFGLPIRPRILDDIGERRKFILAHLFDNLQKLQSQLLEQSLGCGQGCRAMMYGTLSQGMKSNSWLPLPLPPYTSLSISSALRQLKAVEGVDYYCSFKDNNSLNGAGSWKLDFNPPAREYASYPYSGRPTEETQPRLVRHNCRIEDHLKGLLTITEYMVLGLGLSNYLST